MNDPLPLIIANLKANKTWDEMVLWLDFVGPKSLSFVGTIIVCPSSPFLAATYQKIKSSDWKLVLGSQDLSCFEQGAYTGEVAASQIADLCRYVIIGHSERRQNFAEDDEVLTKKVQNALKSGIEPIFCIQEKDTKIPAGASIIAYEPVFAIGTGNPDTPQNAQDVAAAVKQKGNFTVIYGGSVTSDNIKSFLIEDILDGVLVGTKSLVPQDFIQILENSS